VTSWKNARSRTLAAAAITAAFLVPLGIFGGPALAKTAVSAVQYEYSGSSQYQYKVQICHRTHSKKHPFVTIMVSKSALKAHMRRHHDTLGACPATAGSNQKQKKHHDDDDNSTSTGSTQQTPAPPSGSQHGKSGEDHGKSGEDHGKGNGRGNGK
jgi:hypothetical protein